jgi:hypothetical protein
MQNDEMEHTFTQCDQWVEIQGDASPRLPRWTPTLGFGLLKSYISL